MDNVKNCSSKKCAVTCIISVIAVFIFTLAFDWLVNGHLLSGLYMQSQSVFRPMSEMDNFMPWCLAFHFFMALVVTCMFKNYKNYSPEACAADPALAKKCTPCARGICFGVHLGLIFGLGMFATYIMFPISLNLAGAMFASGLVKGIGVGVVLSLFCKKKVAA